MLLSNYRFIVSRTEIIGQDDTDRVGRPGNGDIVLSDPLSSGKRKDDHQQSANEFLVVGRPVLFAFDATRRDTQNQAGWEKAGDIIDRTLEGGNVWFQDGFDHGASSC